MESVFSESYNNDIHELAGVKWPTICSEDIKPVKLGELYHHPLLYKHDNHKTGFSLLDFMIFGEYQNGNYD